VVEERSNNSVRVLKVRSLKVFPLSIRLFISVCVEFISSKGSRSAWLSNYLLRQSPTATEHRTFREITMWTSAQPITSELSSALCNCS